MMIDKGKTNKNVYEKLGLKTIINASDNYTIIGGSVMHEEVVESMVEAANYFVDIKEMEEKVSKRIATLTKNEGCCISSGAAGGILLAAAACMTGGSRELAERLPDTKGMKDEFLICACQKGTNVSFWRMIETAGGTIKWLDSDERAFEKAIGPKTAGIFCFPGALSWDKSLPLRKLVEIGKKFSLPVIVDAAAQLPPVERLWEYTRDCRADLAIFSGGKYIMGPQSTGLILGRKDLTEACRLNNGPNVMIGRPCKVGKEELAGILTAVERLMNTDYEQLTHTYNERLDEIEKGLEDVHDIKITRRATGTLGQSYPMLIIKLPQGLDCLKLHEDMRKGEPSIDVRGFFWKGNLDSIFINPVSLFDDQPRIVAQRLREYFLSWKGNVEGEV
jgi:D-glucosaminate-6-phosphate ammonia-lyase